MNVNNITLTFFPVDINIVKNYFISAIGEQYSMRYIDNYTESIRSYYNQQYDAPQVKFLLFSPKSNPHTTIMFANIIDGYVNLIKYVSKQCDLEYYNISIFDDSQSQMMSSYHFHYYSKNRERYILCYQDPKWVFFDEGEPLWFENISYYKQRIKKNRLNKNIIIEYLKSLGWDVSTEIFWIPSTDELYEFSRGRV
jgi:hypothetical protein